MSFNHSPKIITDGLVMCLDAINSKSYNPSNSTWINLINSSKNVTLVGTPLYTGAGLQFNSSTQYGSGSIVLPTPNNSPITLMAVAKTDNASGWQTVLGTQSSFRQIGFLNSNFYAGGNGGGGNLFLNGGSITVGQWVHICMTYNGVEAVTYKNGVRTTSGSIGTNGNSNGVSCIATYNSAGAEALSGSVAWVAAYGRDLSDAEVMQNFYAIRGRFGL